MDSTNQFSQEVEQDSAVQQQQSPANPVAEELNDTELDAIAGGYFGYGAGNFDDQVAAYERSFVVGKKVG